jgi:hypothetical protein
MNYCIFPQAPIIPKTPFFPIFWWKICEDIRNQRCPIPSLSMTLVANRQPVSLTLAENYRRRQRHRLSYLPEFHINRCDTADTFATGVNDTGGNLLQLSQGLGSASGAVIYLYRSGSRYFHQQEKK